MDNVFIRYCCPRDMKYVMDIEENSFEHPWTKKEFNDCRVGKATYVLVAECSLRIIGYIIYSIIDKQIVITNLAVHPDFRRNGVATRFIKLLKTKAYDFGYSTISVQVRDSNLPGHLFFKQLGFTAVNVIRNVYSGTDDDAYKFIYKIKRESVPN